MSAPAGIRTPEHRTKAPEFDRVVLEALAEYRDARAAWSRAQRERRSATLTNALGMPSTSIANEIRAKKRHDEALFALNLALEPGE